MNYNSRYIEQILTSPLARRGLDYITPIYQDAYVVLWIMQIIGKEYDVLLQWIAEFQDQILPQTATWGLPYWEEEYSITSDASLSTEERRNAVLTALRTRAPMNPKKMEHILSLAVNLQKVEIQENTAKNTFAVLTEDAIDKKKRKKLYETLDQIKPAHLIYWITVFTKVFVENKNEVLLYRMLFSVSHQNLNIKIIRLDGEKQLDGSWQLQTIGSCNTLHKMKTGVFQKNVISDSQKLILSIAATDCDFAIQTYLNLTKSSMVKNEMTRSVAFYQNCKVEKKKNTHKVSLTMDTMWSLSGERKLDGERKLNAQIVTVTL